VASKASVRFFRSSGAKKAAYSRRGNVHTLLDKRKRSSQSSNDLR
jgi:hypothetical protein